MRAGTLEDQPSSASIIRIPSTRGHFYILIQFEDVGFGRNSSPRSRTLSKTCQPCQRLSMHTSIRPFLDTRIEATTGIASSVYAKVC